MIGVAGVLIEGGKVLMIEDARKEVYGCWGPPHGVIDNEKESEREGLIRKMRNEIGVEVVPIKRIYEGRADSKVGRVGFWLIKVAKDKRLNINEEGRLQYGWFSFEECKKLKLFTATRKFVDGVLSGKIVI